MTGMYGGMAMPSDEQREQLAAMMEAQKQAGRIEAGMRRAVVAHAWLLCGCTKRFDWDNPGQPPQAGCVVHGAMMVLPGGEVL